MNNVSIRNILPQDNAALATIIRNALAEFRANKPGTVFFDPTTDDLYELFQTPRSAYHVAVAGNTVVGGAGIFPTAGLDANTCELVKIYLDPAARGKGWGKLLMEQCLATAGAEGYKSVYLETMPELVIAIPLYEKLGFRFLPAAMGNSGHTGCTVWMIKEL